MQIQKKSVPLQRFQQLRALSSAGSERLPYKQRVGGSNPSAPTTISGNRRPKISHLGLSRALSSAGSERLPYKQRVGGSNPSAPTSHIHPRGSHHPPHRQDADRKFYSPLERCRSGRSGRSRKPLCPCGHPGFESLSFRNPRTIK